jgi:hypothetical protein
MKTHDLQNYMLFILAVLLCSCSGRNTLDAQGVPLQNSNPSALQLTGLRLLEGSILDQAASGSISVSWSQRDGEPLATVHGKDISQLKALYIELEHDAAVQAMELSPGAWAVERSLLLAVTSEPGVSQAGIVLVNPLQAAGFSGSGVLAEISFSGSDVARNVSKAPITEASRIDFNYAPDFNLFYWYYRHQGDYDQNGEVNISDLTPLAVHFGKTAAGSSFNFTSVESVVDGDGNGIINISDISPIGINFGNIVESFNIYAGALALYPQNPADPSTAAELANVTLDSFTGNKAAGRMFFQAQSPLLIPATSGAWLRPEGGGSEGIPSDIVGFGNKSPEAVLSLSHAVGLAPLMLTANASASSDPDADPLTFHWFFGDELSLLSSANFFDPQDDGPTAQFDASAAGEFTVILIVRDPDGALDLIIEKIVAVDSPGWQLTDLEVGQEDGNLQGFQDVALTEVAGRPALGYSIAATGGGTRVYMAQSTSMFSSDWDVLDLVYAQSGTTGSDVAIFEVDGTAAVAATIVRPGGGEAVYARQIESGESELYNTLTFETPGGGLSGVTACVANGQAMVAYRNNATGEIRFAWALDNTAQNWAGPVSLNITGAPSSQISMREVNGAPAFVYWAGPSSNRLRYHASVMNGVVPVFDSGQTLSILLNGNLQDSLLVLEDGNPAVVFGVASQGALYGLHHDGNLWNSDGEITPAASTMTEYSSAIHNGNPAVLWYSLLEAKLFYQRAVDAQGTSWGPAELIDDSLAIGVRPTMAEIGGLPAIAYIDQGRNVIRYGIYVE